MRINLLQLDSCLPDPETHGRPIGLAWPAEPSKGAHLRRALGVELKENLVKQGFKAVLRWLSRVTRNRSEQASAVIGMMNNNYVR